MGPSGWLHVLDIRFGAQPVIAAAGLQRLHGLQPCMVAWDGTSGGGGGGPWFP